MILNTIEKPKFTQPCNNCGLCCKQQLCQIAIMAFGSDEKLPCPALTDNNLCGFVDAERKLGNNFIAKTLGIGLGCSMPDEETTDSQISDFDNYCFKLIQDK